MLFKDLPMRVHFFLPNDEDVCRKTGPTTAVDRTCAPGFCFTVRPDEVCDLAVLKDSTGAQPVAANLIGS